MIGKFKLGYGIDLEFNVGKVGDTSYLGDYVYSDESEFSSEISLGKTVVGNKQFFDGDLSYKEKKSKIMRLMSTSLYLDRILKKFLQLTYQVN